MSFRKRTDSDELKTNSNKKFILGANKGKSTTKNFNMRFSEEELELLKEEALKNNRSMQQHLKFLLWSSISSKSELS